MVPEKNGPRKISLREKGSPESLNDFFISINWFHYTHKKMFDVYVTILHMH